MVIDSYIKRAETHLHTEQEAIDAKLDAYDAFISRVNKLQPDQRPSSAAGIGNIRTTHQYVDVSDTDHCKTIRKIFADTIRSHSVADVAKPESLLETIQEEFSETIAVALAPTTNASFTPEVKQMVLSDAKSQRMMIIASQQALNKEESQLTDTAEITSNITDWISNANETPLSDLSFESLMQRHETLATYCNHCEIVACKRQDFLRESTNNGIDANIRHQIFIPYVYQDMEVNYPVLATVANLASTCKACQRSIRDHLSRRV